jgi:serine/threonine protein phosphatase PrpC
MVSDAEILQSVVAGGSDLERICQDLIERANAHGGADNITTVVVQVVD